MNNKLFIAKRLSLSDESRKKSISFAVFPSIAAVALSVALMITALSVVTGFNNEIHSKLVGFTAHLTVKNRSLNVSDEISPIKFDKGFLDELRRNSLVKHVQTFALKPGIIKSKTEIQGIVFKGVDSLFDNNFLKRCLVSGTIPDFGDTSSLKQAVISQNTAQKLNLQTGNKLTVYFIQNPPRIRVFTISGIFKTDFDEFDKNFALCHIRQIQKLNNWNDSLTGGYEILLNNFADTDKAIEQIGDISADYFPIVYGLPDVSGIKENYSYIFDWLSLSDVNILVIIVLMSIISVFNLISAMLVVIIEKNKTIGILKALGAENRAIKIIFLQNGLILISKGLVAGNILAYTLLLIQHFFGLVSLDPASYYISVVPVVFSVKHFLFVNLGAVLFSGISLLLPLVLISKTDPVKIIQFD